MTIGAYSFHGCTKLKYIAPVDGLESIGNCAFQNCSTLRSLYLPHTVKTFGADILKGCSNLTVECTEYSFATIYCINADIPVEFIGDQYVEEIGYVLDREATYYIGNTVSALANGYMNMNLAYGVKKTAAIPDKMELQVRIPSDMLLIEKSLTMDGELLTGYTYEDNLLTFKVTNRTGNVAFCVKPTGDSTLTTYALMNVTYGKATHQEILGIINERIPMLSINASKEVNDAKFTVSGIAPAGAQVQLFVNGTLCTTTKANLSGSYQTTVALSSPKNYATYTVSASTSTADNTPLSASTEVKYCLGAPILQSCVMTYEQKDYDLLGLGNSKPIITFAGGDFGFKVKFSNPEQIDTVYICSNRSNVVKRLEAEWDQASGAYIAHGLFDPSDRNYVPGTITVQYTPVQEKLSFESGVDYATEKYVNNVPDPIKAVLDSKIEDYVSVIQGDKSISGSIDLFTIDSILDFNITTDIIPSYLDPSNADKHGYQVMEDDYGAKLYLKVAEMGEDHIRGEIIDFAHEEIVEFLIDGKYANAAANVDGIFAFSDALGYVDKMVTWNNNNISLDQARQSVLASSMSPAQKAAALKKLEYATKANHGVIAAMGLQIILAAAGIAIPFPCSMILPLLSMQNSAYVNDILSQFGFLNAKETDGAFFTFRWRIDPSGYVYDATSGERLPGVTTTAYYIPYDDTADFFDRVPADTEYGTLWDATEWEQINPLITDQNGRYAWDVPEGWWRVKYEKEGYATTWSHWMTVPPVQENVNIGMMPTTLPDYQIGVTNAANTYSVTLTNNTSASASIMMIVAAYNKGQMVNCSTWSGTLAAGGNTQLNLANGTTAANELKVFVLDQSTKAPLRNAAAYGIQ